MGSKGVIKWASFSIIRELKNMKLEIGVTVSNRFWDTFHFLRPKNSKNFQQFSVFKYNLLELHYIPQFFEEIESSLERLNTPWRESNQN